MSRQRKLAGFALVEIAIALIILALLGAGALTALRVQSQRSHLSDTRMSLDNARSAILGYVAANGTVPCPAATTDGIATYNAGGNCANNPGRLPWSTLGITQAEGQDAWGQTLSYMVATNFTTTQPPATANTITLSTGNSGSEISGGFISICSTLCTSTTGNKLSSDKTVALALWSTGEDQHDNSYLSTGTLLVTGGTDDVVIWMSRYVLLDELISAGRTVQP
ncbi:MAG TPA: hypothetical protein VFW00_08800 [Rhodocyclaceae bacterium]|nr:hypothetical protein [Rhodocyclaceae bacterium]